jgi:hypothetical protein
MPNQTARQQARRAALDAQTRMRQARAEQERRRSALAVTVVTALAERDALVLACEARAGEALRTLTGQEGLSLREAVAWCGGDEQLTVREATRLRRVEAASGEPSEPASATTGEAVVGESARPPGSGEDVVSSAAAGEGRGAPR